MKNFGSNNVSSNLIIVQSTAVINCSCKCGIIQALPTGSGSLETKISLAKISVQLNLLNVSFEIYLALSADFSRKLPLPTLPVCISRIPLSDWSSLSIQSPSSNTFVTSSILTKGISSFTTLGGNSA